MARATDGGHLGCNDPFQKPFRQGLGNNPGSVPPPPTSGAFQGAGCLDNEHSEKSTLIFPRKILMFYSAIVPPPGVFCCVEVGMVVVTLHYYNK